MIYYDENSKLSEMIDLSSRPVCALAARMNVNTEVMAQILTDAYVSTRESGKLSIDSDGISFETKFASITLVRNTDFGSNFYYYTKFTMKNGYQTVALVQNMFQLPETLDHVNLTVKNKGILNRLVTGSDEEPNNELIEKLKAGYLAARQADGFTLYGTGDVRYMFDTGLTTQTGEPVKASIRLGRNGAWFMNYVGYENIFTPNYFNAAIKEFAVLDDIYLADLAALAKPEKWYFGEDSGKLDILENYIAYTFYRLQKEDKICINSAGDFAAFNTGLASATYDDIYMCFRRRSDDQKWKYAGICTAKGGSVWKKLIGFFNPLPKPAQYFNRKEDILFDMSKTIYTDTEHIIYDRLHRIPTAFLRPSFSGCARGIELLDNIDKGMNAKDSFEELKEIVEEDDDIFNELSTRLEQLVNKAVRIIRWNYRLAIPSYYPKGNTMSLLLPLDFTDSGTAQAALVVQMMESGNYIGHTLLNMRHAYLNARLISSQESSWLTA